MARRVLRRVTIHDRYQLEFKLGYPLTPGQETRYKIDTYIFVPRSLGIDRDTYTEREFYRDIQNYVRMKTPRFRLRELLSAPHSPLNNCERILHTQDPALLKLKEEELISSFKFLRAILKSAIRAHLARYVWHHGRKQFTPDLALPLAESVDELLETTQELTRRYRALAPYVDVEPIPTRLRQSYRLTDEAISLVVEEGLLQAFLLVDRHLDRATYRQRGAALKKRIEAHVQAELQHRQAMGYGPPLRRKGDNEEYLFRTSILKKYTSSVLWLSTSVKREGTTLEHVLYALAAGVSMVFATVVAFYFQLRFGTFTFPVFVALVVGYMFKDRIKEIGRSLSARFLHNILYDRRTVIHTQDRRHELGYVREKVEYVSEKDVPAEVLASRDRGILAELANDRQGETIIRYTKAVVLHADALDAVHTNGLEITAINDIMRYDIRPYLRKMDNPTQRKWLLENGKLYRVRCHKTYHLNFVSVYRSVDEPDQPTIYQRTQVVLDRKGICRIVLGDEELEQELEDEVWTDEEQPARPVALPHQA